MTKKMIVMLVFTGLFFGAIFGFKAFIGKMINQFFDTMPPPVETITAAEVEADAWIQTLETVGTFEAVQGTMLTTEAGGIVESISFESGSQVERGEILLRLETSVDEAEQERLAAVADLALLEFERVRQLHEQRSASKADLERRESEHAQAVAAAVTQQARVDQKILRAPFDGFLGIRRVNLGEYVSPGTPLVALQSIHPIYLNFTLPAQRYAQVEVGMSVEAVLDGMEEVFTGQILAIEPGIDASTRNFTLQAAFDNPEGRLRPGMFAKVVLALGDPQPVLIIPQTAVSFSPYGNSVYVLQSDEELPEDAEAIVRRRFIQTGERRGDLISVTVGLDEGDQVASSGLLKLRNDTPVRLTGEAEPSAELRPTPPNR